MNWEETSIGELGEFRNGLNYSKENEGKGLKVIAVKDFGDLRTPEIGNLGEIDPSGVNTSGNLLEVNDIVFVRSNGNKDLIGRSLFIEDAPPNLSFSGFCIRMRPNPDRAVPKFLAYFFRSPLFRKRLSNLGGGTNIQNLNQKVMKSMEISLPAIGIQREIVHVISAYDDLIENNRRRIALLEEAARQLYKEWFVCFRFPGHEHTKIINDIPSEWKNSSISSLVSFLSRGMTPKYDESGEYIVINQKCIRNKLLSYDLVRKQSKTVNDEKLVRYGDVLINSTGTGTLGRVAQCWDARPKCTVDTHVTIARPNNEVQEHWFGYCLMELETVFEGMGEGATNQKELKRDLVGAVNVPVPPRVLQEQFGDFAHSSTKQIVILQNQNKALAQARDLLLPKLMSGEIDVSNLNTVGII